MGDSLITTLSAAFGFALILGFIAAKIRLPALVGYLLAGILIGPFTPGLVVDMEIAQQFSQIGIMLLMFGVGLNLSLGDILSVRKIALPGSVLQVAASTTFGATLSYSWGWEWGHAIAFGLSISIASTVVLLRSLEMHGLFGSINGKITIGWFVVQDILTVLVLVLLPPLAGWLGGNAHPSETETSLALELTLTLGKVALFIALMLIVGRRLFPWMLWKIAGTGSHELFTLSVVAVAISIAYGASMLFGVSIALGAFFAGMVLRESKLSHRAATESLPLRDAFAVLFFVSVGMLFNPQVLMDQPLKVLEVVAVIMIGTPLVSTLIVLSLRYPLNTALVIWASLSQIGEFSFILTNVGIQLGLLSIDAQSLVLAAALISIAVNPLIFRAIKPMQIWIRSKSALARIVERPDDPLAKLPMYTERKFLADQIVLIGYGRVGHRIGEALAHTNTPYVVVEENREVVEKLREKGIPAVSGDAGDSSVLIQAHIARAGMLIIAIPDILSTRKMITTARTLNPQIKIIIRTHSEEELNLLEQEGVGKVFFGESELAASMINYILNQLEPKEENQSA
ncbi:cation:proton antiporter [Candidatus Nitrosacidococcus sp. I8]|uniref:cation:proton antiporter n=1 Tax=Candidatus Nitrosacidococcus sp. I8 TaxID=2942908 RepID=UPI00222705E0|nr:cation:proton antiporter [Candidatus Nitrosacidococcus sp. I8]CAH9019888.1 Putative cation/proton antiporter YbaL [Candidatus Nitrosacidococcus sp. I8]